MLEAVGSKVLKLVRTGIGPVRISDLPIGKWRMLTPAEVEALTKTGDRLLNHRFSGLKIGD
jgi:16S rRNA U516 pseudouridylate synthase RsuA-like enzyme